MIKNIPPDKTIEQIARLFDLQPKKKNINGSFFIKSTGEFFISKDDLSYNDVVDKLNQYFRDKRIINGSIHIDSGCILYTTLKIIKS